MILGLVGKLMSHKNGLIPIRKSYTFKKWPKLKRKEQRVFRRHEGIYKVGYTGVREQECLASLQSAGRWGDLRDGLTEDEKKTSVQAKNVRLTDIMHCCTFV
jgi:hypothetical protein